MPKGKPRIDKELVVQNGGRPLAVSEDTVNTAIATIYENIDNPEAGPLTKTEIARLLGIRSLSTVDKYMERYPALAEAVEYSKQALADEIVDIYIQRLRETDNVVRDIFAMKALAGFSESKTVEINHNFNWQAQLKEAIKIHSEDIVEGEIEDDTGWN